MASAASPAEAAGGAAERTPVWLDCDPGHDDAMALILAGHSPCLELLGVSTVAAPGRPVAPRAAPQVTANALNVLHLAGLPHVPVHAGAAKPLLRPARICDEIHGDSGLDGPELAAAPRAASEGKAVNAMWAALAGALGAGRRPVLICTGALTNAALLLSLYPELAPRVRVVLMGARARTTHAGAKQRRIVARRGGAGGAMGRGNTGPVSEFNIQVDPEAAHVVFESGADVTMVPLEVTHTALVTPAVLSRIGDGTQLRRLVREMLLFFQGSYRRVFGFEHPPLHDPYVIAPQLFEVERYRVDVETGSALSAGQTVVDVWRQSKRPPNAGVATRMDVGAFWDLMLAAVDAADAATAAPGVGSAAP